MNNNLSIINIVYNNLLYLFGCEKRVNSSLMLPDLISDHQEIILKDSNNWNWISKVFAEHTVENFKI